ncbi:hypothetical protein CDD80_7536 [Ophiocordyceps camponoti-rufipedis]|uniref:MACPF domain-containing protein n=1 Tax=Ophiocordyceps camponoti-rufipedis TaxID=2004952 RepID=A0A2C5Z7Y6_9HYPO|nr:hypothetical protein CDD80_7536 [Ophiocordyceps camponoti-rufipedis]
MSFTLTLMGLTLLSKPWSVHGETVPYTDGLTLGQGYNTFTGMGAVHGAVDFLNSDKKQDTITPVASSHLSTPGPRLAFAFTPPSDDLTGLDSAKYFAESDRQQEVKEMGEDGEQSEIPAPPYSVDGEQCSGLYISKATSVSSFTKYLKTLDVSASAAISGWGQSASMSGSYLDQAKFSKSTLTYVASMAVSKQLDDNPTFRFNIERYKNDTFTRDFGDRWIRGFARGGRMVIRVSITKTSSSSVDDLKAKVEGSLSFWGATGELASSVKASMESLSKDATVDVSVFFEGDLGHLMHKDVVPKSPSTNPVEDVLSQTKQLSDVFREYACSHNYRYGAILESYRTLSDFPQYQDVADFSNAIDKMKKVAEQKVADPVAFGDELEDWMQAKFINEYMRFLPPPPPEPKMPCSKTVPCYDALLRLRGNL